MAAPPPAKRLVLVWGALVAATVASALIGADTADFGQLAGLAALAIAYLKVRFVLRDFMELRHAPRALGIVADMWIGASLVLLGGLYLMGGAR